MDIEYEYVSADECVSNGLRYFTYHGIYSIKIGKIFITERLICW